MITKKVFYIKSNSYRRPQTGKVANVILDGDEGNADDDADEFLVEEKPKDAIDLDLDITAATTGPSSGLNSTDVSQK